MTKYYILTAIIIALITFAICGCATKVVLDENKLTYKKGFGKQQMDEFTLTMPNGTKVKFKGQKSDTTETLRVLDKALTKIP